jgi:hypothetical protein
LERGGYHWIKPPLGKKGIPLDLTLSLQEGDTTGFNSLFARRGYRWI